MCVHTPHALRFVLVNTGDGQGSVQSHQPRLLQVCCTAECNSYPNPVWWSRQNVSSMFHPSVILLNSPGNKKRGGNEVVFSKNIKPRQPFFRLGRVSRRMEDFSTWLCTSSVTWKKPTSWDTNSVLGFFLVSNTANCALNLGQMHDGFMMWYC